MEGPSLGAPAEGTLPQACEAALPSALGPVSHWQGCGRRPAGTFFNKFIYFLYLFLAVLGLRCCARASSSCGERGLLLVAVSVLLIAVASLVAEHGL